MARTSRFAALAAGSLILMSSFGRPAMAGEPDAATAAELAALREELALLRTDFERLRQEYADRIRLLEQRLESVGTVRLAVAPPDLAPAVPPALVATPEADAAPLQAPVATAGQVFNPDTSVIGNFLAAGGRNPNNEEPALQLSEAEVSFQAAVDPYARANVYLAAGPEGVELEEAYATFTSLPAGLLIKAGKLRAQFGKVNTLHTHAMPTADRPLVTGNLLGGEEGLSDGGVSVAHLVNNPWLFLEATAEVFGSRSDVFQDEGRDRLTYVGRVRGYQDLSEDKNLEVGVSFAHGPTTGEPELGDGVFTKQLFGVDATFRFRPLRRAIYRRLNLRTELVWSRQDLPDDGRTTAFGFYGLGEYQFARRWYIGGRVDRSGRAFDGSLVDQGGSVFLSFWPTEFSQIRGQYRRTRYAEEVSADEFLFQMNFSIGAHGAHVF